MDTALKGEVLGRGGDKGGTLKVQERAAWVIILRGGGQGLSLQVGGVGRLSGVMHTWAGEAEGSMR